MKRLKKFLLFLFVLGLIYAIGPRKAVPQLNNLPLEGSFSLDNIEEVIAEKEANVRNLKAGNEAEIVWADDSIRRKTDYCLVYLPGFGASKGEGEPLHREIAKRYGMNLYLARLSRQGVQEKEPFLDLTEEMLVESAKEAVLIGKSLGKKVIVLSTSTGGTLGFYLAAKDHDIASVIAWSPNTDLADPMSALLPGPWGLQLARLFLGSKYRGFEASDTIKKWWINHYRIEGLITLKSLLNTTMTDDIFASITQPVYLSYYYKNEEEKDQIISIERLKEVYELLGTPKEKKRLRALSGVSGHCMGSSYYSTEAELDILRQETFDFIDEIIGLSAKKQTEY